MMRVLTKWVVAFLLICADPALAQSTAADALATWNRSAAGAEVWRFYEGRAFEPAWSASAQARRDRAVALSALSDAADEGLEPKNYAITESGGHEAVASARYDLALTGAVLRFAHDLRLGRVAPNVVERFVALPAKRFDAATELAAALAGDKLDAFFRGLAPPHPEYVRLRRALDRYRALAEQGGWHSLPPGAGKPDAPAHLTMLLWKRLAIEDASLSGDPTADAVDAAVRRFQARNGLEPDGRVGPKTLAALNMPVSARIAQIVANMERWRWVPRSFGPTYIEVNTADATLKVVDAGRVMLTSRIVAGKPSTPTPMFAATVTDVTVNPYWNIPSSIVRNEILPKERAHPGYLAAQHIETGSGGLLRQIPGDFNALGRVKLEMPNRFNSYLHDTPAKALFAQDDRHFSHGCMRVQEIRALASFALTRDVSAGLARIEEIVATGTNTRIPLDKTLPVYVLYWTAIAHDDGTVDFRRDAYGRDDRLLAALAGQRPTGRLAAAENECRLDTG